MILTIKNRLLLKISLRKNDYNVANWDTKFFEKVKLHFDDVLLSPAESHCSPNNVNLKTNITHNILTITAAMDAGRMIVRWLALTARAGGLSVIHNMPIANKLKLKVKRLKWCHHWSIFPNAWKWSCWSREFDATLPYSVWLLRHLKIVVGNTVICVSYLYHIPASEHYDSRSKLVTGPSCQTLWNGWKYFFMKECIGRHPLVDAIDYRFVVKIFAYLLAISKSYRVS